MIKEDYETASNLCAIIASIYIFIGILFFIAAYYFNNQYIKN